MGSHLSMAPHYIQASRTMRAINLDLRPDGTTRCDLCLSSTSYKSKNVMIYIAPSHGIVIQFVCSHVQQCYSRSYVCGTWQKGRYWRTGSSRCAKQHWFLHPFSYF